MSSIGRPPTVPSAIGTSARSGRSSMTDQPESFLLMYVTACVLGRIASGRPMSESMVFASPVAVSAICSVAGWPFVPRTNSATCVASIQT